MYSHHHQNGGGGGTSPMFDVPDFSGLRRVKPLPKRRRVTSSDDEEERHQSHQQQSYLPIPPLPPDATPEEIIAHADQLSSHMALQNYYMPILGGMQDLLRGAAGDEAGSGGSGGGEDGDGDYFDHLQQPGNTKKRKVPANLGGGGGLAGDGGGSAGNSGGEEDSGDVLERKTSVGDDSLSSPSPRPVDIHALLYANLKHRKGRMPAVTRAGLKHKETLRTRKRQLATVLGALSQGDTIALDQALSSNYAWDFKSPPTQPLKIRLSKRTVPRLARAAKVALRLRHPDKVGLPTCEFSFVCHSATADRLIATKEEVSTLRHRFEQELAKQAAKAAKLAAKTASSPSKSGRSKRSARRSVLPASEQPAQFLDPGTLTVGNLANNTSVNASGKGGKKKKKRSALANASNPHHLRNYVPSRLPNSGGVGGGNYEDQNFFGPLPLRFLAADLPPRRGRKRPPLPPTTNPADEWICAYCEYELFYGDDQVYRRAIRKRKKILRRRQRARERAAAAANGGAQGNSTAKGHQEKRSDEDYDAGYEPSVDEFATIPKQTRWRRDGGPGSSGGGGGTRDGTSYG